MRVRSTLLCWQALLLVTAGMAHAVPVSFGTAEYVTVRTCTAGVTPCDNISPVIQGEFGGLAGYGSADGSVALSGVVGAPVLRASASAEPGARTNTNSVALQRYTYTGTVTTTRTFGGTLTYSQTVTGPYPTGIGSGVSANIDIFTLPTSTIEVGATADSNFFALFSPSAYAGYASLGSDHYSDTASTATGVGALDVTVTLNPGDSVWVWALLQTPATHDALIDASNTLLTAWDNAADLVPAAVAVAVPEPATTLLVGLALVALGGLRQRPLRLAPGA